MKKFTQFSIIFFLVILSLFVFASAGAQDDLPVQGKNEAGDTTIDVWYGKSQNFGKKGNPQQWVNILGNVTAADGIKSLTYTFKGTKKPLSIGPDNRRLVKSGDFNIEIDHDDLSGGSNTVTITATDNNDKVTKQRVTINYSRNKVWPQNYDAEWTPGSDVEDTAQVVDGKWSINGAGKLFPVEVGYDRLVAIGDIGNASKGIWTDYEVTVPITVKGLDESGFEGASNGPAVGLAMRFQGHTMKDNEQPRLDLERIGAIGRYRWQEKDGAEGLELRGYDWRKVPNTEKILEFDTPYIFKMSVQSGKSSTKAYYRLKFWKKAEPEPADWDIEGLSGPDNSPSGSMLLVAHHVDAEFGDVKIRRLADLDFTLDVDTTGSGAVSIKPILGKYEYGQRVTLTAVPAEGYYLESWSGDLLKPGTLNPLEFDITKDMAVTANFKQVLPGTLTVNIEGQGQVTKNPDKDTYEGGELVTLTAVPEPGSIFTMWSGDLSGTVNPAVIMINGDQAVTATFEESEEASPISDEFNRCELYTDLWTFVNPSGSGAEGVAGSILQLTAPAGPTITMWDANRDAPRIMQETADGDFTVEIKFASIPQANHQIQGFLAEQDADNWIRFDFLNKNGIVKLFAGVTIAGSSVSKWSEQIDTSGTSEIYMRVKRVGDTWTQAYSLNGTEWLSPQNPASFDQSLQITKTGVFAGNENSVAAPGFVAHVDYFRNTAFPSGITGYLLGYNVLGAGDLVLDPLPDANGRYMCSQQVSMQATPAEKFLGWSGELTGTDNPVTLTMDKDIAITAAFINAYTLNTEVIGQGQVTVDPEKITYDEGDLVTLTAVPARGYAFIGWGGDAAGANNPLTMVMDKDMNVTATFIKPIIYLPAVMQPAS